jgi:hypothetical protein
VIERRSRSQGVWDARETLQMPPIALDQVLEALAYYLRNRDEIDHYIELNRVPDHLAHPLVHQKIAA